MPAGPHELSVVLCNDSYMKQLNLEWRGKAEATDVLSYEMAPSDFDAVRRQVLGSCVLQQHKLAPPALVQLRCLRRRHPRVPSDLFHPLPLPGWMRAYHTCSCVCIQHMRQGQPPDWMMIALMSSSDGRIRYAWLRAFDCHLSSGHLPSLWL
jgi:hypothetical protein